METFIVENNDLPRATRKASGVCSHCFVQRQLHIRDGTVHEHGPRNNRCPGSHLPPLTTAAAVDSTEASLFTDRRNQQSIPNDSITISDSLNHPDIKVHVIKHIPKSARFACSSKLTDILGSIAAHPENLQSWRALLEFATTFLRQPSRAGRNRKLSNVIKSRLSNLSSEGVDNANLTKPRGFRPKPKSPDERLIAAITAKLEDGNIRAATRILCDNDHPIEPNAESFAALQEKHPSNTYHEEMRRLPTPTTITTCLKVSVTDVEQAINSFPKGSAGGPDGFRPQHLVELVKNKESAAELLRALTDFTNVILAGKCPIQVTPILFGGNLIALSKKSGGLRPIAIGYIWRRLTAKCANRYAVSKMSPEFMPFQIGVGCPGGCEAAVHAARTFIANMRHDQLFVKLDFANAFNSVRRDVMLRSVYEHIPELYPFIYQSYADPSILKFGPFSIRSEMGPQQGDPLGPLLFCLPLQPTLRSLQSQLKI